MRLYQIGFLVVALVAIVNCGEKDRLTSQQSSGNYVQEFNPEFLDVLWVVDDRSTLYPIRNHLISEAQKLFVRLEGMTQSYRMGFITSDMLIAKGKLKPTSNPIIVERHIGDTNSYSQLFANTISSVIINLGTGAEPKAFEASEISLNQYFQPRAGVPLVLIYISDSDDKSVLPSGVTDAATYYADKFIALKGNAKLVKAYAVNYTPTGDRCTGSVYNADIDKKKPDGTSAYEDRFFSLATKLGGDTADICGSFSEKISLEGLRLKELPNRFKLDKRAKPDSITVVIVTRDGSQANAKFHFEAATNEIVFDETPPQGSTVQVSYLPM